MSDEIYRTKTGRILTDPDIEALAEEAERGYESMKCACGYCGLVNMCRWTGRRWVCDDCTQAMSDEAEFYE